MKHFEIERRFLLYPCSPKRFLKSLGVEYEKLRIVQFYEVAEEGRTIRWRRMGGRFFRTKKKGRGLKREEEEIAVSRERFREALKRHRGGVIEKVRYLFELDGTRYELDRFRGALRGLVLLEVEFGSVEAARRFSPPGPLSSLIVAEVTENSEFSNGAISRSMRIPPLQTPLKELLAGVDRRENFLKASLEVEFGAYESAIHALKAVLYSLVRSVEANRRAMLSGDEDPERLHQFRVAMRKQRALLSRMEGVVAPRWAKAQRSALRELMRRTGDMRDVDVYLAQIPFYLSLVGDRHRKGMEIFQKRLEALQKERREALAAFLREGGVSERMRELERFCRRESAEGEGERARVPVALEVKPRVRRQYARVVRKGKKIGADTDAEVYHALRIEVKKLRYLMEFFSPLFEAESYGRMLLRVKKIQTILGEHQDLDVQRDHLKEFLRQEASDDPRVVEALETLRDALHDLQRKKRKEFREAFDGFADSKDLLRRMICHF